MLIEIQELGFRAAELSHGIRITLLEGVDRYLRRPDAMKISSLHNFCPLPVEISKPSPNCYEFSSHRSADRERAIRLTLKTIDFAERFGAGFVVLHLGHVPIREVTRRLTALAEKNQFLSRFFVKIKLHAIKERERLSPFYMARVKECLKPIVEAAAAKNIRLGIETREAYEEIPTERELPELLDDFDPAVVGYWHDIGHAQIRHNLGFINHAEWLARVSPRLIGCHLHDVAWPAKDHLPPFRGKIDYETLVPLIPPGTLYVFEMAPRRNREHIRSSREQWEARFGGDSARPGRQQLTP